MEAILNSALFLLFRLLARWRRSRLAAWLLLATTRRLTITGQPKGTNKPRHRALVMTRQGFLEDVEESFASSADFVVLYWPSFALKAFAAAILSPKLDHNNYLTGDEDIEATKLAYRKFLAAVWRHYTRLRRIDVVLTGNFAYFTERELATALEEAETPFIALHKENVRPPRRVKDYWFTLYKERRGKFTGRKVLVYNDVERELEISSGIAQPQDIIVTGAPRLDKLHRWRREHAGKAKGKGRPKALFFAFSRQDKLTAIQRKKAAGVPGNMEAMQGAWGKLSWGAFCVDTHRAMVDLARERPDIDVIVKSKGQSRKLTDIMQILDDIEEPLPDNLKFIPGGDPFELITDADVIVGFNTTGLLEAIAAGKPVVVPMFGEAREESMQDLIIDLGPAVEYAPSPAALKQIICRHVEQPAQLNNELPAPARATLSYWVGNDDGNAGARVLSAIEAEIGRPSAT